MSNDIQTPDAIPSDASASTQNTSRIQLLVRIALVLLVALELGLFYMLRSTGWNRTGDMLQLAVACVVIALPVVTIAFVLVWNRFRFGMRGLLLFMCCTAAFFWISAIPFWRFEQARSGARSLREAKIQYYRNFDRVLWNSKYLDQTDQVALDYSSPSRAVFWLAPFVKESSRVPEDRAIQGISLKNDSELQFFLDRHRSFEGLLSIMMQDPSEESLGRLKEILPQHPSVKEISFGFSQATIPPLIWEVIRENKIPMLVIFIPSVKPAPPFLPSDMVDWDFLRTLVLSGSPRNRPILSKEDVATLRRCNQLRLLVSYGIKALEESVLKEAIPNCEVKVY